MILSYLILRYPKIPLEYLDFLKKVAYATNPTQTAWFLCEADFQGTTETQFRWNEFEQQSLEAAESDDSLKAEIQKFWDQHFPIMTSVKGDYAYLAIDLSDQTYGSIVWEYEASATKLFGSFEELLVGISKMLKKEANVTGLLGFV